MPLALKANRRPLKEELKNGDHMSQAEFHRLYQQMPEDLRAELIGGIVYVSSPPRRQHGVNHLPLGTVLFAYRGHTPGVECGDNTTLILCETGEPQPDLFLRILPEFGGQSSTNEDDYIVADRIG
jgi:Uma2 family endonuclease